MGFHKLLQLRIIFTEAIWRGEYPLPNFEVVTRLNYIYGGHRTDEVNTHFQLRSCYERELYLQRPSDEVNIYFPTSKLLKMRFIFTEAIWRGEYPFFLYWHVWHTWRFWRIFIGNRWLLSILQISSFTILISVQLVTYLLNHLLIK